MQLLCTEEDFGVLKKLYLFTGKVLEEFSGESKDPPVNWATIMISKAKHCILRVECSLMRRRVQLGFNKEFIDIVESMRPNGNKHYRQSMALAAERFQAAFDVLEHFHDDHLGSTDSLPEHCSCTEGNKQEVKWIWRLSPVWSHFPAGSLHSKSFIQETLGARLPETRLLFLKAEEESFKLLLEVLPVCMHSIIKF